MNQALPEKYKMKVWISACTLVLPKTNNSVEKPNVVFTFYHIAVTQLRCSLLALQASLFAHKPTQSSRKLSATTEQ